MLPLQTIVELKPPPFSIHFNDTISLLGSCFAQNIGSRLQKLKFSSLVNPFGVLFNPASVANTLNYLQNTEQFNESDLHLYGKTWFSFNHTTAFSDTNKVKCLEQINNSFINAKAIFNKTNILIITLGTARVYRYKQTGSIVANCHKIPASEFSTEFLNPNEIAGLLSDVFKNLINQNPNLKIILTVSPIRHWKDGATENMRSKASLLLAIKELEIEFPNLWYFPVYEIFMDELRDYRFYADDMFHPSDFAISYIFKRFEKLFFSKETQEYVLQCEKIVRSLGHRPLNPEEKSKELFLTHLSNQLAEFQLAYPHVDFANEYKELEQKLNG